MTSLPKGTTVLTGDALFRAAKAVGTTHHLLLYVGDWLAHLNLFTDAQLHDILRFVRPAVEHIATLPSDLDKPVCHILMVAGYRWVSVSGIETVWDSQTSTEQTVCEGRHPTYITCDIMVLRRLADEQEKVHDAIEDQLTTHATRTPGRDAGPADLA